MPLFCCHLQSYFTLVLLLINPSLYNIREQLQVPHGHAWGVVNSAWMQRWLLIYLILSVCASYSDAVNCWCYMVSVVDGWMHMEHLWRDIHRGTPKYLEKSPSLCHFVHHHSHVYCSRSENGLRGLTPTTKPLSHARCFNVLLVG